MSDAARITRTVDSELPVDELWDLVADGGGWQAWMVDDGSAGGDRRVCFTWWPPDRPDFASTVELVVLPAPAGSRLRVTETYLSARTAATALAWDVRIVLVGARAMTVRA